MSHKTRSSTKLYLIGQPSPDIPDGRLPTHGDLIRDITWKRQKEEKLVILPITALVSCQGSGKTFSAHCHLPDGCLVKAVEDRCTLQKLKIRWQQAGFKTVSDKVIRKKLVDLSEGYQDIKKRRERKSDAAKEE